MPSGIYERTEEHKRKLSEVRKGIKLSKKHKRNISIALKGRKFSEEHRKKLSENNIGMLGKYHSEETKRKMSKAQKGNQNCLGRKHSEETKRKMSKANLGNTNSLDHKHSTETKKKMSKIHKGKNNSNWQGGISFEPYSIEWNEELKEQIRKRDNYTCQRCGIKQEKLIGYHKKLTTHHIDYNKKNNKPENLITLCQSCNAKANFNRNYWTGYFQGVINAYT